jgi:hypothetical protein
MHGLGVDDLTQVMGVGTLGEVRQGPDGNLYQWVQGVDGLGNPIGFWRAARRFIRRRVMPLARRVAPLIPGVGPAVAAGIRAATPVLRQAGLAGYDGLGALYQAPDGAYYQVAGYDGYAGDEELAGLGVDDLTQVMGVGTLGEVRQGPDGNLYQWVQGVDGLGNPIGFWRAARRFIRRRVMPLARRVAPLIPGVGPAVAAGIRAATPVLRRAGLAGYDGLGALYQAPDGAYYQVAGHDGYAGDEELSYISAGELKGYAGDEELGGLDMDDELGYLSQEEELLGYADASQVGELGDLYGYVPDQNMNGLEAYITDQPAGTRQFTAQAPETWRAIW